MLSKLAPYWKAVVAVVGAAVGVAQAALSDGGISDSEWWAIGIAALTALGVYLKANQAAAPVE